MLHSTTCKDWTTPTNLYNLISWTSSTITLFESKDFNQHLVTSHSTLKPYFIKWLIYNRFLANFGTYNTSPIHLEIPFSKLKTIVPFPHTSNILLSPRYNFVIQSKFLKGWKCFILKVPNLTNDAPPQTKEINKVVTRSSILLVMATCGEPLNYFFQSCLFLWHYLAKWPLVPQL